MPTRPYDPWRDADGTPILPQCRIQQIAVGKQHGALSSRLHQQGQVLGRGTTRLIVQFDHQDAPVSIRPHLVRVLTTPGDCSVSDTLTELERAGVRSTRCDAAATTPAGGTQSGTAQDPVMSTGNGTGIPTAAATARPVLLLRYRPGVTGQTARTVHLVPLPPTDLAGAAGVALCGALLCPDQVEPVTPGHGVPCSLCVISHASASPPPAPASTPTTGPPADHTSSDTRPRPAALDYHAWGWPVTLRRNQIWLTLQPDTVALIIPALLAAQVTAILSQRRCPPPVLAHPDAPDHRLLLAGEPYDVDLPWPPSVHRATGALPLPPTRTPHGPVTWVHPPQPDALRLCREVDVFAALRTALRHAPPADPSPGDDPP